MPRISDRNINTPEYWNSIYRLGKFPTDAQNNKERYDTAALLQVGITALDIGCGQGGLGKALRRRFQERIEYTGIDFVDAAIDNSVHPHGTYHVMGLAGLPTAADTVYVLELIEHMDEPTELLDHVAKLALRRLVVGTPRYEHIPYRLHRGEHLWDFTTPELLDLLGNYGRLSGPFSAGLDLITGDNDIPNGPQCCVVAVDV